MYRRRLITIAIGAFGTMIQDTVNDLKKLKLHIQKDAQQKSCNGHHVNVLNLHFKPDDLYTSSLMTSILIKQKEGK